MVTGKGEIHTITEQDADDLGAARINLGALGIITEVTLDCRDDYGLEYTAYLTRFDEVLGDIDTLIAENDRVVLWWLLMPLVARDTVILITKNETGGPRGRLAGAGVQESPNVRAQRLPLREEDLRAFARQAPARGYTKIHHVISNYDEALTIPLLPVFHRECEYAIPVAETVKALKALREAVDEGDMTLILPVEVRFVAKDDILLSPCNGRDVGYIGASTLVNATEVFELFEPIMRAYGGKPHWGKNFTLTQEEIAKELYPTTYDTFRQVRDRFDPDRVFANTMLRELFP
jgi:FAD/FMN-containing dehydrogenase